MVDLISDRIVTAKRARPRGFADWRPNTASRALVDDMLALLIAYEQQLPITLRQMFYLLVARYCFEKSERAYGRLGETLNRARRAKLIPMAAIRDDGGEWAAPWCFGSADDLRADISDALERATFNASVGQPFRQVVICEAAGMVPMLTRVAYTFGAPVRANGGFDSTTKKHDLAELAAAEGRPVMAYHIGDHDPSGAHIFQSQAEDAEAFAADLGGSVVFRRVAVTPDQIARFGLPTAPPKASDRRAFEGQTVQAEALPPDVLQGLLREALAEHFERKVYRAGRDEFEAERRKLARRWMFAK